MQAKLGDGVIVIGTVSKDAEFKHVGDKHTPICSFSIIAGKRQDTTTIFVNCKAWRHLAVFASEIQKGDTVCVIGKTESREYNGKTYTDLNAEWINFIGKDGTVADSSPKSTPQANFVEIGDDDGELPF